MVLFRRVGCTPISLSGFLLTPHSAVDLLKETSDESFLANGGWFQPLPSLEEQSFSILHVFQGWTLNLLLWAITLTVAPVVSGKAWRRPGANRFLSAFLSFTALRLLYPVVFAAWSGNALDASDALLDTYVIGLLLGTARYLLGEEE
jgi:hypothetical protein